MKQAVFPAGIGCLLVGWRGLTSSRRLPITMSTHMTAAAFVSALIAGIAANGVWKQIRAEKLTCAANNYIQAFTSMVQNCRALDNSLYAALRFVQEVDFVSRGFRLPHQSTLFAQTPKRGSLLIAQNMRQAIDSALAHMLQTLFGIEPDLEAIAYGSMSCVDDESDTDGGNTSDTLSLDMLRGKFNTQFEARRAWIDSLLEILEPLSSMSISQVRIHIIFDSTVADIQQLDAAAVRGLETVRKVRESQYTSRQWASLAQNTDSEHNNQPLRRALGSMSTVLATIQAKMSVCQECINVVDSIDAASEPNGKDTSKEAAALFASLKLDIDVLSAHYQDCVAMLHDDNTGCSGSVSGAVAEISAYEDEPDTPLDGVNIYGYTPLGSSDLDAPYMLYEADAETSQTSKRPHATLDRIDRIRMQKQNRIDEETAKQKKNDVFSMINELKVAIDSRSKDHLDPNSDKS
ncbi:hypothetical protein IW142_004290 [Coemansia sp. RSA 564]|nr:hypothetical protein IW142_004290 [Coemansia sp. RSA 564]